MPKRSDREQAVDVLITRAIHELDGTADERATPEAVKSLLHESMACMARAYTILVADTKRQKRYANSVFTTLEYLAVSIQRCREVLDAYQQGGECEQVFQRAIHRSIDAQIAVYQTVEVSPIPNLASI